MKESKPSHQLTYLVVMWLGILVILLGCYDEPTSRLQVRCVAGVDTLFFTDSASRALAPVVRPPIQSEWIIHVPTDKSKWSGFNGHYKNTNRYVFVGECSVEFLDDR